MTRRDEAPPIRHLWQQLQHYRKLTCFTPSHLKLPTQRILHQHCVSEWNISCCVRVVTIWQRSDWLQRAADVLIRSATCDAAAGSPMANNKNRCYREVILHRPNKHVFTSETLNFTDFCLKSDKHFIHFLSLDRMTGCFVFSCSFSPAEKPKMFLIPEF